MLNYFIRLCRYNFGAFEKEEFKKFLRMGIIFSLIIGVYWTLRPLKDAVFIQLVDKMHLPYAKTISVLGLLPLVMFYTKLLQTTSRERMLVILPTFYGISVLVFGLLMLWAQGSPQEIAERSVPLFIATKVIGYVWYLYVESFGSLVVALFWAFSTDTTVPESAKRGFPLVVAFGQLGGVICPYSIGGLPHRLGLSTDALSIFVLSLLIFSIIPLVRYLTRVTPKNLMTAFEGQTQPLPARSW